MRPQCGGVEYTHRFDPDTHRCTRCGRWERGFKPASKGHKHGTGECQVCERAIALDADGRMVHHGYTRPGYGFIVGDCFGVGYLPYTDTEALRKWAGAVADSLKNHEATLADLRAGKHEKVRYQEYVGGRQRYATRWVARAEVTPEILKGYYCTADEWWTRRTEDMVRHEESEIQNHKQELKRIERRIKEAS